MAHSIVMPALSAGMEEGTIARWLKGAGDVVVAGDFIAEIETDKATMDFEAEQAGVISKIFVTEGETVAVNAPIALLVNDTQPVDRRDDAPHVPFVTSPMAPATVAADPTPQRRTVASPLARRIAAERNLTLEGLEGSGPRGRIIRLDVESMIPPAREIEGAARPDPDPGSVPASRGLSVDAPHVKIPLSNVRRVIARRLTKAKATIPHFYLEAECEIDALLDLRATLNSQGGGRYKLSVNDFVIKAAALALRHVPEANTAWTDDAILQFQDVDISVAVATDGGLITPIVRQADRQGLAGISADVKALAERARDGRLQPSEYQGGSFTVSNLGMFGVRAFSAIINPPQSCILAIGAAERRPVVRNEVCVPATVMSCTLSVDHRAVDGAVGARYLAAFKSLIEQPLSLLL